MEKSVIPVLHVKWSSIALDRIRLVINDSINDTAKPTKSIIKEV